MLAIHGGKIQKDKKKPQGAKGKAKGKNKLAYARKTKIPPPPTRDNLAKDYICHHCKEGLRESKKLKHRALSLYMGNGMHAAVEAIRSFDLILLSDNVFYFNAIPRNGIYEIDMHSLYPNVSSNYSFSNKRSKHGLDSYYLWHCRLGHINKKRMDMLQHDGLLQPTHDESHEKCKSCISGKMAYKPFPHQVERAKDLLGLIHTNVCGPFRIVSRDSANYFITFTDDFNRYGYHKETMGYYFYYPLENKIFVSRNAKFFENSFMVQEVSRSHRLLEMSRSYGLLEMSRSDKGLEIIQEEDTQPSKNTSKEHNEIAPTEEYELGDLDEPPNYKAALADLESDKWLKDMNTEMQSMKDN
ncbi:retrotransposon protein, putative, ty1-copia subclass [Tanacetum coccineum]